MLDLFLELGMDVLIGIDPLQGRRTELGQVKEANWRAHLFVGR